MSHSAVSSAPMVPNTAPAWPALKVCRSIRSYRAVTPRGSSPSMAAKTVSSSTCGPRPTPVMPSSVSTRTIGTRMTPSAKTPLASPTGRPQSWTVVRVR